MAGEIHGKIASVVDVDDKTGQGLVLAYIIPDDNRKSDEEKKKCWSVPLLPRVFGLTPKVGEKVLVFVIDGQRFYIGPIYGQLSNLDDASGLDSTAALQGSASGPGINPEMKEDVRPALPDIDDVAINGKGSSGIYVKKKDIVIHSGIKVLGGKNKIHRNTKGNEAAIQVSYDEEGNPKSSITLHADVIGLFGNSEVAPFESKNLNKKDRHCISNEDLLELMRTAQSIPYGEKLCKVLLKIISAILNHTHPIATRTPFVVGDVKNISEYVTLVKGSGNANLNIDDKYASNEDNTLLEEEILSPNVKIN